MASDIYNKQLNDLIEGITRLYSIEKEVLFSKSRKKEAAEARQILAYCLRKKFTLSFSLIGKILKRDHTTAIHSCDRAPILMEQKDSVKDFVYQFLEDGHVIGDLRVEDGKDLKFETNTRKKKLLTIQIKSRFLRAKKEYYEIIKKLRNEKREQLIKIKGDYKVALSDLEIKKKRQIEESIETHKRNLDLFKRKKEEEIIKYRKALEYLQKYSYTAKTNLLAYLEQAEQFRNFEEKEEETFLPKFKKEVELVDLPLYFDEKYIDEILSKLKTRTKNFIVDRFGLHDKNPLTLQEISSKGKMTRERVRQIIEKGLNQIYYNNYGGVRQIIQLLTNKILKEDIITAKSFLKEIFIFKKHNEALVFKFLFIVSIILRWVKQFELAGVKFLINIHTEGKILQNIDSIKKIIDKIEKTMPDSIGDKWQYIYNNLGFDDFFQDKKYLLNEDFLRACYDNHLFEGEFILYRRENLKRYNLTNSNKQKISGVPKEYQTFFQ